MKIVRKGQQEVLKLHRAENGVVYLTFPGLERTGAVRHLFSTREGGVSGGIYASMNLSYTRGDRKDAVDENYRRIAAVLGSNAEDMVCSDQTHTDNIRLVTAKDRGKGVTKPKDYTDVDGLITQERGIVLCTFFADCVPLFFVDPVNKVIGLSHSGWRGTVQKIGKKTVEKMQEAFGTDPGDIHAAIGPSICQDCYEVSEDVIEEFRRAFPGAEEKEYALRCKDREPAEAEESADLSGLRGEASDRTCRRESAGHSGSRGEASDRTCPKESEGHSGLRGETCDRAYPREPAGHSASRKELCGRTCPLWYLTKPGKYQLNLWEANRLVMLEAGIPAEHIEVTDLCTCCNPEFLFSHRASHGQRGNLGAFMKLV